MAKNSFIEKNIRCRYTLELPHRGNSNVYLQHMFLKIRKKEYILEIYVNLPISIKIPVTLLQIVYICMTANSPNSSS